VTFRQHNSCAIRISKLIKLQHAASLQIKCHSRQSEQNTTCFGAVLVPSSVTHVAIKKAVVS